MPLRVGQSIGRSAVCSALRPGYKPLSLRACKCRKFDRLFFSLQLACETDSDGTSVRRPARPACERTVGAVTAVCPGGLTVPRRVSGKGHMGVCFACFSGADACSRRAAAMHAAVLPTLPSRPLCSACLYTNTRLRSFHRDFHTP